MQLLLVVFFVLIIAAGIHVRSGFSQEAREKQVTSEKVAGSSRAAIRTMLRQVENRPAPETRPGAMCYKVAAPPEYQEYVCPLDAEKSVYQREDYEVYGLAKNIEGMRRTVKNMNSVTQLAVFELDESRMCHVCSPDLEDEERHVSLVVRYPDGKEHRTEKIKIDDLWVLEAFFRQKPIYSSWRDAQLPVKDKMGRIKELLGLEK